MRTVKQMSDMSGRLALITGGAGFLGRAMASALAEHGCGVVLVDRDEAALQDAALILERDGAPMVATLVADLEGEAARDRLIAQFSETYGRLNVLINNAGFVGDSRLSGWAVPFEAQSVATFRRALDVNLAAPFHLAQGLAPLLRASGNGAIINIGSIYGTLGPDQRLYEGTSMGNPAGYAGSKGGLIQLTRWLATTLAPDIRVNSISPGGIARGQADSFVERYVARTPLGRMGSEEDFKGITLLLASDLSAWMSGQNIMVDGGWTAW
jgi:NAD(P)-dependent dehydrogenase (short-subunit alcohol dehydrogenase family)